MGDSPSQLIVIQKPIHETNSIWEIRKKKDGILKRKKKDKKQLLIEIQIRHKCIWKGSTELIVLHVAENLKIKEREREKGERKQKNMYAFAVEFPIEGGIVPDNKLLESTLWKKKKKLKSIFDNQSFWSRTFVWGKREEEKTNSWARVVISLKSVDVRVPTKLFDVKPLCTNPPNQKNSKPKTKKKIKNKKKKRKQNM